MTDDAELLRRYAEEHSETAFADFVQRHLALVYAAALRRTNGDENGAAEVAQQVFTTAARRAAALARHDALTGWLYTATRNAALNLRRDEQRRRSREHEASTMNELVADLTPEADWNQLRPVLDEAMDELNGPDREAVLSRFFEGRAFTDVGKKLHLTENAARHHVDRSRAWGCARESGCRRGAGRPCGERNGRGTGRSSGRRGRERGGKFSHFYEHSKNHGGGGGRSSGLGDWLWRASVWRGPRNTGGALSDDARTRQFGCSSS